MVVSKIKQTKNVSGLIGYQLDDDPHTIDLVQERNLYVDGFNIDRDYNNQMSSAYTKGQFYAVRKLAHKEHKKTQAYHLIFSFSDQEFPFTKDQKELKKQAKDADTIIKGFLEQQLPRDSQYLLAVQRDGEGHKMHVHVALNSVLLSKKTLNTNDISLKAKRVRHWEKGKGMQYSQEPGLFENLQTYMHDHFKELTGRDYTPVSLTPDPNNIKRGNAVQIAKHGVPVWREELKDEVREVIGKSKDLDDFKRKLESAYNVHVKEYTASVGKDDSGNKIKRPAFTYQIMGIRQNGNSYVVHSARDYRIMKNGSVRGLGEFARPKDIEREIAKNNSYALKHAKQQMVAKSVQNNQQKPVQKSIHKSVQRAVQIAQPKRVQTKKDAWSNLSDLQRKYVKLSWQVDEDNSSDMIEQAYQLGVTPDELFDIQSKRLDDFEKAKKKLSKAGKLKQAKLYARRHKPAQKALGDPEWLKDVQADEPSFTFEPKPVQNLDKARKKTKSESGQNSHDLQNAQSAVQNAQKQQAQRNEEAQQKRAEQQREQQQKKRKETEQRKKRQQQRKAAEKRQQKSAKPAVHHYFDDDADGLVFRDRESKGHDFIQNMPEPWKDNEDDNEKEDDFDS